MKQSSVENNTGYWVRHVKLLVMKISYEVMFRCMNRADGLSHVRYGETLGQLLRLKIEFVICCL